MFPGRVSRLSYNTQASAAEILANADVVFLTGNTTVSTIRPHQGGVGAQLVFLVALDDNITLDTGGNIAVGETLPDTKCVPLIYNPGTGLWYPVSVA